MNYAESGDTKVKSEMKANGQGHFKSHELSYLLCNYLIPRKQRVVILTDLAA